MKNFTSRFIAGLFAIAILVGSFQPALAYARNDSNPGKGNKDKTERVKENKNLAKYDRNNDDDDEDEDDDSAKRCLPRGILHAWGIEKRIENGKGLPFGLFKKFVKCDNNGNGNGTTTATTTQDTRAPRISNISVAEATSTATVTWRTDESTTGSVRYGTTSNITSSSTTQNDGSLVLNHSVGLTGLTPNTTYYYVIVARDTSGNTRESSVRSFTTDAVPATPQPDTTAPQITFATTVNLKATTTQVVWITNEASNSKLWISTTTPVDISVAPTASSSASVFYHDLALSGLATSTTYYYTLVSEDSSGNKGTFTGNFFQTLAQ
jgi:hypothetical protein